MMNRESILQAILEFHEWHSCLPSLIDLTSLEFSYERGQISEEEFEMGKRDSVNRINLVSEKFSSYEKFFDLDFPFYFDFLSRLKLFGESIDESKEHPFLKNPGFTKALITDVLNAISDKEKRETEKIWIFLRCGDFLKEIPELK